MPDVDTEMEQAEHEATVDREIRYLRAKDEARSRYAAEVDAAEPDDTPEMLVDGAHVPARPSRGRTGHLGRRYRCAVGTG